jgi:hypothetical protein
MIVRTWLRIGLVGFLLLLSGGLGGCVDYRLVRDIVRESDAELLGAELGREVDAELRAENPRVRREAADQARLQQISALVDRIDAFVESHPGADRTNAALSLRKGLLLLEADRYEAARASFAAIPAGDLAGERDRLLHALAESWVWWHQVVDTSAEVSQPQIRARVAEIEAAIDSRPELSPALSDWFEFFRAQVALTEVRRYAEGPERGKKVIAAVARFYRRYSSEEAEWIQLWSRDLSALSPEDKRVLAEAPLDRLRGFDLARALAEEALVLARDLEVEALPWPESLAWVPGLRTRATRAGRNGNRRPSPAR